MRWVLGLLVALSACTKSPEVQEVSRYESGKRIYTSSCVQCHGDPKVGSFGPPIYGSSFSLLNSKVIKGKYPEGYVPKRSSGGMPVFGEAFKDKILPLYCYLNDKCKTCPRKGDCKGDKGEEIFGPQSP